MLIAPYLSRQFGPEWAVLNREEKQAVYDDFRDMLRDEYDTPDDTMDFMVQHENATAAVTEYARRIGRDNLYSYARCQIDRLNT